MLENTMNNTRIVSCPVCKQELEVNSSHNDEVGKCPKCSSAFKVVADDDNVILSKIKNSEFISHKLKNTVCNKTTLINETSLTDKAIKYFGLFVGVLLVFILLLINENTFGYGLFANDIYNTWVYNFLIENIVGSEKYYDSDEEFLAYFLWFLCFGIGVFLSWKYRVKTANLISKILTKIHKEI